MTPEPPAPALLELLRRRARLVATVRPRPRSRFEDEQGGELLVLDEERAAADPRRPAAPWAPAPAPPPRPEPPSPTARSDSGRDGSIDGSTTGRRDPVAGSRLPAHPAGAPPASLPPATPGIAPAAGHPASARDADPPGGGAAGDTTAGDGPAPIVAAPASARDRPAGASHPALRVPPREPSRSRPAPARLPGAPAPPPGAGRAATRRADESTAPAGAGPIVQVSIGRVLVDARPGPPPAAGRDGRRTRGRPVRPGPDLQAYLSGHSDAPGRDAPAAGRGAGGR